METFRPTTFYPRATNFEGSQVIHLADGQDLLNADIHVSDPLPTRQITVRQVWGGRQPEDSYSPQVIVNANKGKNPFPDRWAPRWTQFERRAGERNGSIILPVFVQHNGRV